MISAVVAGSSIRKWPRPSLSQDVGKERQHHFDHRVVEAVIEHDVFWLESNIEGGTDRRGVFDLESAGVRENHIHPGHSVQPFVFEDRLKAGHGLGRHPLAQGLKQILLGREVVIEAAFGTRARSMMSVTVVASYPSKRTTLARCRAVRCGGLRGRFFTHPAKS